MHVHHFATPVGVGRLAGSEGKSCLFIAFILLGYFRNGINLRVVVLRKYDVQCMEGT